MAAELRAEVVHPAMFRCEYCWLHEDDAVFRHEVDHIVSRQNGGETTAAHLVYACMVCNRHKGSNIAYMSALASFQNAIAQHSAPMSMYYAAQRRLSG